MTNRDRLLLVLFSVTFISLGAFCVSHALGERASGKQSIVWPVTEGVVAGGEIEASHSSAGRGRSYSPRLKYDYKVGSNSYTGSRIRYAAIGGGNVSESRYILDKYPPGTAVRVYYNPKDASESVLEPGAFGRSWMLLGAGIAFAGFGVAAWCARRQFE